MKFYVADGKYFLTKDDASRSAREVAASSQHDCDVEIVDVGTTRDVVLRMLNVEGGHTTSHGVVYTAKAKKR